MKNESKNTVAELIGAAVVLTMIFAAVIVGIFGPERLWELLSGEAAPAWVQAVGSVIAIVAAYYFGQSAHRQQMARDAKQQAETQLERILILQQWFRQAHAVDYTVLEKCSEFTGNPFHAISEIAAELIEEVRSIQMFDLPDHELVFHLMLAKQAAMTYRTLSNAAISGEMDRSMVRLKLKSYAESASAARSAANEYCEKITKEARERIEAHS